MGTWATNRKSSGPRQSDYLFPKESENVSLKLNIQKTKIMASGPITSWQIDGETVADFIFGGSKTTADFIFWGSKITAAIKLKDAYSLERKL